MTFLCVSETKEHSQRFSHIPAARRVSRIILMPGLKTDIIFCGNKYLLRYLASSPFPIFPPQTGSLQRDTVSTMVALRARGTWRWPGKLADHLSLKYGRQWQLPLSLRKSLRERMIPTTLSRNRSRVPSGIKSRCRRKGGRKAFLTCQITHSFGHCKPMSPQTLIDR